MRNNPLRTTWKKLTTTAVSVFILCGALLGVYVLSVVWRVAQAEHEVMGKDMMLFVFKSNKQFTQPATIGSYLSTTFEQDYKTVKLNVWRDKVNGFQHTYGSALAAYEWGDFLADKLFVANEFAEWLFDRNGVSERDPRDRHRDLSNNKVGRKIGVEAWKSGLLRKNADDYIRDHIVAAIEFDHSVITHWRDPIIDSLPSESAMGCPNLPTINGFDCLKMARRKFSRTRHRLTRRLHYYWNKVEALVT